MRDLTILFDMDGTLLDLAFDDMIWESILPQQHAALQQCHLEESHRFLKQLYSQHKHSLNWYSSRFWQQQTGVDALALQIQHRQHIQLRRDCLILLDSLKQQEIPIWLLTNADQASLKLKLAQTGLSPYFQCIVSSEQYGFPKEEAGFWQQLQLHHPFDPAQVILVDDNLAVLQQAEKNGITQLFSIVQPSSSSAPRSSSELVYPALEHLSELLDYLNL
ncbi:HAD-IA family hydrolase [Acinetobacter larvae]|uniref:Haloacid dehalogenase n=1 Tax=Acinetobacter larvae TaxID=1789224 RepID=A0A1B2M100_9GAMM|nr:HAD-IA family hydrolase [Acinetobacter larvae]AOA58693.1 haloacid dehalogenase [Acinetobacter larvae]